MMAEVVEAVDETAVAVFAFRDARGRPMAWPVTPYLDGESIVVTSTLAYIRKAQHVRRDGRIALLAGGFHLTGRADVRADPEGEVFVTKFLEQELRKYPPARQIVRFPLHRAFFSWYFGRVMMAFAPLEVRAVAGDDRCTLITLDESGFPEITPLAVPDAGRTAFVPSLLSPGRFDAPAPGPATVLCHLEPTMSDLRQLVLRGEIRDGAFHTASRTGSLHPPAEQGWLAQLRSQLEMHRRGRRSRRVIQDWDTYGLGDLIGAER